MAARFEDRAIDTKTVESISHQPGDATIRIWTADDVKFVLPRKYWAVLSPGTVFDAEWDGLVLTGIRINGVWLFHHASEGYW